MLLLVLGVGLMIYGIIVVAMRCGSEEDVPYHTPSKSYMRYSERYYDHSQLGKLQSAIESGARSEIDSIDTSNISAIILACYRSADGSIVAYGLYHYVDMEYCLIGDVAIHEMS